MAAMYVSLVPKCAPADLNLQIASTTCSIYHVVHPSQRAPDHPRRRRGSSAAGTHCQGAVRIAGGLCLLAEDVQSLHCTATCRVCASPACRTLHPKCRKKIPLIAAPALLFHKEQDLLGNLPVCCSCECIAEPNYQQRRVLGAVVVLVC